ncbi:MAG: hypothetical protein MMC23_008602 [Stictis urceolatum]|nr:hypothetical protein [Stictis urceolata]
MSSAASTSSVPPNPSPRADDSQITQRIISHMNKDHADSLTRFLEHHSHLPSFAARNPRLTSLSESSMTITSSGIFSPSTQTIPIDPPMKSLSEARERMVGMDAEARTKLGRDAISVKEYRAPKGLGLLWVGFVAVAWAVNARKGNARWVGENLVGSEGVTTIFERAQPVVLGVMLFLHTLEAAYMVRKMKAHSVPTGSRVWCGWVLDNFFEGVPVLSRFRNMVDDERMRREKASH